jgi:hypothetical protein
MFGKTESTIKIELLDKLYPFVKCQMKTCLPSSDGILADVADEALFVPLTGLVFHLLHA